MLERKFWSSTRRYLRHEVVGLGLSPTSLDQFKIIAFGLEYSTDGEKSFNVVSVNELFASKDIDEVECLRHNGLALSVNNTDNWVVRGFL